jgi:hypothetical protein
MRSYRDDRSQEEVGVELEYYEHCGGLWCGSAGRVWCIARSTSLGWKIWRCLRKRARRVKLPSWPQSVVDEYCVGIADKRSAWVCAGARSAGLGVLVGMLRLRSA